MGTFNAGMLGKKKHLTDSMNILVFTSLYPNNMWPQHGVFIKERMTAFSRLKNCNVKVVAPVPYFPPIKITDRWKFSQVKYHEKRDGLDVYHPRYFMTPKIGMSTYGWMMYWSVLKSVKRIKKNFDFDLIDAHYVYPDGFAAVLIGQYFNKPVVVSARGSDINQYTNIPIVRKLLKHTLHQSDSSIAVCQALKDAMLDIHKNGKDINVIPNGIDTKQFKPINRELARRKLNLPDGKIILSVGQLIPRKGMDILIRAFKKVTELSGEPMTLLLVGEGPDITKLQKLVKILDLENRVLLVGGRPHSELCSYYNAADLFCLASSREGWPNVVMESLACGTPVVATNVWGTPEILSSDELGFLAERSVNGIKNQLLRALQKKWDREAIKCHFQNQTWEQTAFSVHSVFEKVLEEQKVFENNLSPQNAS